MEGKTLEIAVLTDCNVNMSFVNFIKIYDHRNTFSLPRALEVPLICEGPGLQASLAS